MPPLRLLPILLAALALPVAVHAQFFLAGVGAGAGVGRRNGAAAAASHAHALGYLQLGAPLLPVAVRGDALLIGKSTGGGPIALIGSAVFSAPLPVVTPYATVGWGQYGIGGDARMRGWSAGVGVRAKLPVLPGAFGEVRRFQRLGRDLATVGLVF